MPYLEPTSAESIVKLNLHCPHCEEDGLVQVEIYFEDASSGAEFVLVTVRPCVECN